MAQSIEALRKRIDDLYVVSTGKLSQPMCQNLLESEYASLLEELKRLKPGASEQGDPDMARLQEARRNLEERLERYDKVNRQWNRPTSQSELRRRLS